VATLYHLKLLNLVVCFCKWRISIIYKKNSILNYKPTSYMSKLGTNVCRLFLFILLISQNLNAANIKSIGVPYVRNYSKNVYQSGNQNWSISKDENGIMYFGNSEGLLSFDGHYWQLYKLPNKLIVRAVASDKHGKIYTGAFGEIGYWSNNTNGVLTYVSLTKLIPSKYELKEEVWKIYVDDDRVIFQSFGAIFIYKNNKITIIRQNAPYLFMLKAGNRYFIGQVDGKALYEFKGDKLEPLPGGDQLGPVLSILPFGTNRYLIGTVRNGLFLYDGKSIRPWKTEANDFLKKFNLNNGVIIPGKYIAYGTILNGVIIIDTAGNVVQHVNKLSGLQNNTVLSLYVDNEQNLWAGLDNGIDCIEVNSPLYFYFDKSGKFGTVYSSIINNNKIYLGTNQGLFYSDGLTGGNKKLFQAFDFKLIPGSQGQVWDLSLIDGQLICGQNDGTFKVNDDKISKMTAITGGWTIKKLNSDHLMQGTYTGLVIYKKDNHNNWVFDNKVEGFGEPSRYVEPASKNQVWVSHVFKGIYRVTLSTDLKKATEVKFYGKESGLPDSYNINVFNLNGRVVFSSDYGFYYYDDITDKFYKYDQLNKNLGSFYNSNKIIAAYGKKYWFINHGRVAMADFSVPGKLSLNTRQLSILNGRMVQYYENISRINSSIYLISVDDGFVIFNDSDASRKDNIHLPEVLIRKIESISDKNISITFNEQKLNIPFANNSIRISYSLPYFRQSKIRYQYYLEGYSKQWSEWNASAQMEFTNLASGSYTFKIKAQVDDTYTSGISLLNFEILRPWYLGNPALVFYVFLVVLIYYFIRFYYRVKLRKHQQELLEGIQKEQDEFFKQKAIVNEQQIVKIRNEQLLADLEGKSRELANSAMNIVYKNELLQKISSEIVELKDSSGKKLTGEQLRRIQKVIDDGMTDERDWNLFEDSFNEAHESFFKKLKAQHPDLVPNDLKLCAYLRMNMSSKEMASLLNISLRGVEIRRYRLRKKLNLMHDKNLVEFLMEL
jgi:DNA-binding CsgD family transcriptional regulator